MDYIKSVDGTIHASRQIVAIQGDGTNGTNVLFHSSHLSYSLVNFFNKTKVAGSYTAIDFTPVAGTKYYNLPTYNNKIYAEYSSYDFVKSGNSITIPTPPNKDHYNFTGYSDGVGTVSPGAYTVSANKN